MKPKTVISLLAAVLILTAASYFLLSGKSPEKSQNQMGAEFLKNLPINDIAAITIQTSKDRVELKRGPAAWQLQNRFDYPSDFEKVSDFIKKIKRLKVGRTFESNEDVLARQKLYDPKDNNAKEDQKGIRVILADEKGKTITDLILGKDRTDSAGGGGQYLRHTDGKTVYLVSDTFSFIEQRPQDWLQSEVINIAGHEINAVACYVNDSNKLIYKLERKERGAAPQLLSASKENSIDNTKIDQVFESLSPLNVEDISGPPRTTEAPLPVASTRLEYHLYDGRIITVYPASTPGSDPENGLYNVTLTVAYTPPPKTSEPIKTPETSPTDVNKKEDEGKNAQTSTAEDKNKPNVKSPKDIEQEALSLNEKLKIWTFNIAKWQYDSFIVSKEGLMKAKEEAAPNKMNIPN